MDVETRSEIFNMTRAMVAMGTRREHSALEKASKEFDKTHCAACGTEIPPGRAGRRCEICRAIGASATTQEAGIQVYSSSQLVPVDDPAVGQQFLIVDEPQDDTSK